MELYLTRKQFRSDGIFGTLQDKDKKLMLVTLEHSYWHDESQMFHPKVPAGDFRCIRGKHHLFHLPNSFETFEITGVPGHSELLFHPGNYNNDSEGCVLLGTKVMKLGFGAEMIANSKAAFKEFMEFLHGQDEFRIHVSNEYLEQLAA